MQAQTDSSTLKAQPTQTSALQVEAEAAERSPAAILLKRVVQAGFFLWVLPRLLFYWLNARVWGRNRAFLAASESISRVPGQRGVFTRQAFYRSTLDACGRDIYFGFSTLLSMSEARVGDRTYIGRQCSLGFAAIGSDVMIADQVVILSGGHEHGKPDGQDHKGKTQTYSQVRIGDRAWIGSGSVIMADVGAGSMIGAGSVVTRPIPDGCVAVGSPARVLRRFDDAPPEPAERSI